MAELGAVTRALLALAKDVQDDGILAKQICQACVDGLDVDGASISLYTTTPARQVLWASDATAELLEDLQFTLGEGACMQAAATGRPVLVPDLDDTTDTSSWPIFAAAVTERTTAKALFALPLQWGTISLGVLNFYRTTVGSLGQAQWRDAVSAADTATLVLLGLHAGPGEEQWLDHSMRGRVEIHQATGMVVAQLGVTAQDALARLRAYAFAEQRLLGEVAHEVVSRRLRFSSDT